MSSRSKVAVWAGSFDLWHSGYAEALRQALAVVREVRVLLHRDPKAERRGKSTTVCSVSERRAVLGSVRGVKVAAVYEDEAELRQLLVDALPAARYRIMGDDYGGKAFTGDDLPYEIIWCGRTAGVSATDLRRRVAAAYIADKESLQ